MAGCPSGTSSASPLGLQLPVRDRNGYARRLGPIPLVHLPRIPSSARELTASVIRSERPVGPPSCRRATPVSKTDASLWPVRAPDLRALRLFHPRPSRYVDAGSCGQSGARQAVGGMVVGEKNRYVRINASGVRRRAPFSAVSESWKGQFQGQCGDNRQVCQSRSRLYLAFSPR